MSPKYSIIIPTYNRAGFISIAIHSLLSQVMDDLEVIIIDDGSTDNTEQVVKAIDSPKVHYFKQKNGERANARNYGIKKAKGQYITFLDSDDLFYPNFTTEAEKLIQEHPDGKFFHLAYEIKNTEDKLLSQANQRAGDLNKQLVYGNGLSCIGVILDRSVALENLFNEDRDLSGTEDWELWIRIASRHQIYYTNTIVACMINHEDRSVLNINEEKITKRIDLAMKYAFEDDAVAQYYKEDYKMMYAHLYLYISLHLVLSKKKKRGWHYWAKAFKMAPSVLATRKTLAIIKHTIL